MKDAPAFPHEVNDAYWPGLTLRDYFAARAMQAWLSTYGLADEFPNDFRRETTAELCYEMADAMLKARHAK